MQAWTPSDHQFMKLALRLALRARGETSPNPLVGAVLTRHGKIIGRGWHRKAGLPHAEIEALQDAARSGHPSKGATLYVTLEPCSTEGRTPPCTGAILSSGVTRVVAAAPDPNPVHRGRGFRILEAGGISTDCGLLEREAVRLNEPFNHWIVSSRPWVTVKAAMTLDGKIATEAGESRWITSELARRYGMRLRRDADAILVGINTILADDPKLTLRLARSTKILKRLVLDSDARTPLDAQVLAESLPGQTTIVVRRNAPVDRVKQLEKRARVWAAPERRGQLDLRWLLRKLGAEQVTHLLVEGGGNVNATFLLQRLAHQVVFFYAPLIFGGRDAPSGVSGITGAKRIKDAVRISAMECRRVGPDLVVTGRLAPLRAARE